MKALLIYASTEHGNTRKVSEAAAEAGDVTLVDVANIDTEKPVNIAEYDLIGFGSGIFGGRFSKALMKQVEDLKDAEDGQKAFAYSTGSFDNFKSHKQIDKILEAKGYTVLPGFTCKGYNTFPLFKPLGGLAKGHPNEEDFTKAKKEMTRLLES